MGREIDESLATDAEQATQAAQLFRRCAFINSEQVRQETGV